MSKKNLDWSLFLDRDGVINKRITGYISEFRDFEFRKDFIEIFPFVVPFFWYIFIVTNQQGIGKGLMSIRDLESIHKKMMESITAAGGKVDRVYFCPHLVSDNCGCRKPEIGMALSAQRDYPGVDFERSVMIGDSESDIEFGRKAGMKTILLSDDHVTTKADYIAVNFIDVKAALGSFLE